MPQSAYHSYPCRSCAPFVGYALLRPLYEIQHFALAGALTLGVFLFFDSKAAVKSEVVERSEKELSTGDAEADALLKAARADIAALESCGMKAVNEEVRRQLMRITVTADKIVDFITENPKSAPKVRRFLNYFLPTTKKLMDNYMVLAVQEIRGENIDATMARIEGMLSSTADAFDRQLDALFADTAVDVAADISVMQSLMAEGGLAPEEEHEPGGIELKL